MEEIRYKNAIVRIHGTVDREKIEKATQKFAKAIIHNKAKRERKKEETS